MPKNSQISGGTAVAERPRPKSKVQQPRQFNVVFHNDDTTTFEFVIYALMTFFRKNETEAARLTLKVHNEGQAIVGTYSYDMALTLTQEATREARAEGYPLKITIEPVETA